MRRVGITGHQNLNEQCAELVRGRIADELRPGESLIGFSSLAAGADQLFAEVLLGSGGSLTVVLPCHGYERTFSDPSALRRFNTLLARAVETIQLPFAEPSEDAFWSAGQEVVGRSEILLAVWDGEDAAGLGGTGDVVRYAREQGVRVEVIWPTGCARG